MTLPPRFIPWRAYNKRQMYAYLYGARLPWWKRLLARLELRRRLKKRGAANG